MMWINLLLKITIMVGGVSADRKNTTELTELVDVTRLCEWPNPGEWGRFTTCLLNADSYVGEVGRKLLLDNVDWAYKKQDIIL